MKRKISRKEKSKAKLSEELVSIFSRYIRQLYSDENGNLQCVTCGKTNHWKKMQAGHYHSSTIYSLKWDERNVHPQCYGCNIKKEGRKELYTIYLMDKYGDGIIRELQKEREKKVSFSKEDYIEMINIYEDKIDNIGHLKYKEY